MKTFAALVLCVMAPFTSGPRTLQAQEKKAAPPPAAAQSTSSAQDSVAAIDPKKEAAIRNMFEVTGMIKIMQETISNMVAQMRPVMMTSLPQGEYREKLVDLFFEKFQSKLDLKKLLELAVPIYAKYYTTEEIGQLTEFYKTPIGKKSLAVTPKTMSEMQAAGGKMGEEIGRQTMMEVLAEHPDLAKALSDAAEPKN
jgi:hypothetical protein